jgi:hypothetical protein
VLFIAYFLALIQQIFAKPRKIKFSSKFVYAEKQQRFYKTCIDFLLSFGISRRRKARENENFSSERTQQMTNINARNFRHKSNKLFMSYNDSDDCDMQFCDFLRTQSVLVIREKKKVLMA